MWKRIKERKRRKKWKKKIFARTGGRTTATMLRVSDSNHSAMRTFVWGQDVYVDKLIGVIVSSGRLVLGMGVDDGVDDDVYVLFCIVDGVAVVFVRC